MQSTPFKVRSWADLPAGIVAAEQAGAPGLAHLLRALKAGRIAFLPLLPESSNAYVKTWAGLTKHRPAVILLPDDDYQDRGPASWPTAARAVRWAVRIVLHAAGAELHHYEAAIQAAQLVNKVLFIECSTSTAPRWVDLINAERKRGSTMLIWPREGSHPILPSQEALQ